MAALIDRIIDGLSQDSSMVYERAERRARLAFLSWVVSLPPHANRRMAARAALTTVDRTGHRTVEVELFRRYLEAATRRLPRPARSGGSAARRGAGRDR